MIPTPKDTNTSPPQFDMTSKKKNPLRVNISAIEELKYKNYSITYEYTAYEVPIVLYAITQILVQNPNSFAGLTRLPSQAPDMMSVRVSPLESAKVLREAVLVLNGATIQFAYYEQTDKLFVTVYSSSKTRFDKTNKLLKYFIEKYNFYQGKCLKFESHTIEILDTPKVLFNDVILQEEMLSEYKINTVDFLTNEKLRKDSKKRSVILYGPPGTGKTSMVSATFNELNEKNITTAYLTSDIFNRRDLNDTIKFCIEYLAPLVLCFEDIDLIGYNRDSGHSSVIGPLLSVLNGIEEMPKPIVFIATTNRFDVLDSALTRPCRIDRRFKFDYPSKDIIRKLFLNILKVEPPDEIYDIDKLTGAHIKEIFVTAKILAAKNDKEEYVPFIADAIKIIKENFYIGSPKTGFSNENRPGGSAFGFMPTAITDVDGIG